MKKIMKNEEHHSIIQHHTVLSAVCFTGQNVMLKQDNDLLNCTKNIYPVQRKAKSIKNYSLASSVSGSFSH